jgi:hypothetical protein
MRCVDFQFICSGTDCPHRLPLLTIRPLQSSKPSRPTSPRIYRNVSDLERLFMVISGVTSRPISPPPTPNAIRASLQQTACGCHMNTTTWPSPWIISSPIPLMLAYYALPGSTLGVRRWHPSSKRLFRSIDLRSRRYTR